MRRRFIFSAGRAHISVAGAPLFVKEIWIGVEIESDRPVDLEYFSREHGIDLIPAETISLDELRSVGVEAFGLMELHS